MTRRTAIALPVLITAAMLAPRAEARTISVEQARSILIHEARDKHPGYRVRARGCSARGRYSIVCERVTATRGFSVFGYRGRVTRKPRGAARAYLRFRYELGGGR